LDTVFSEELKVQVLDKIAIDHLYDEEELEILKEMKEFIEDQDK
jgi:hypothetical protein